MIVYALYHPATGNYMPSIMFSHTTRGYSWWEPLGMHGLGGYSNIPRLFETKHAANMARHAWARGTHKNNRIIESDGWEFPSYEVIFMWASCPCMSCHISCMLSFKQSWNSTATSKSVHA